MHLGAERHDRVKELPIFQVREDLMPVLERAGIPDSPTQHARDEITLVPLGGDRLDHLIQAQVSKKLLVLVVGRLRLLFR